MSGVTAINVPGLGEVELADWIDDQIYGTAEVDNGQTSDLQIFVAGAGQQKPGSSDTLNEFETNVPEPGRMPNGYEMLVFSIALRTPGGLTVAEMQSLKNTLLHEFWIVGKVYSRGHLEDYPVGGGITGTVATTATSTTKEEWNNGAAAYGAVKEFRVPHKIGSGQNFYSKVRFPTGTGPVLTASRDLMVKLRGLVKRLVQ